ncbi:MAG: Prolyl oligopeptidase family protein [Candidatus Aminicenantes bacterium ADurb.Bin508]|nr:MAG: Prolyl oligopeptidase family protein [Candidatus Aminicenantes bacterium ADurb.Bin508]
MPEKYIQNSPLFSLYKLTTPLLIQANDDDDTVPWEQGIELFMALRRLEKPAYLFNYTGEGHSLNKGVNRFHWTQKVDEFFNRFLRHEAEPAWMAVDEEGRRRSSAKE